MNPTDVLLADERVLLRTALAAAFATQGGWRVAGQCSDAETTLHHAGMTVPAMLVLSATLPGASQKNLCQGVLRAAPGCRILVLGPVGDQRAMLDAFDAGAHGYVLQDLSFARFLSACASLLHGEAVVPPGMLGGLLHELVVSRRREEQSKERLFALSRREREVLGLLAAGRGQDGIARALVISPQTARTHIQNVITKLGVHSRVQAVAVAIESGLVQAS